MNIKLLSLVNKLLGQLLKGNYFKAIDINKEITRI